MWSLGGVRLHQEETTETKDTQCSLCNYKSITNNAVEFCSCCEEWLGTKCKDFQRLVQRSRNDKTAPLTQMSEQAAVINESCDSKEHRKSQSVQVTEKGHSDDKNKLESIAECIEELRSRFDTFLCETNGSLQYLKSVKDTCTTKIKEFREELIKKLDVLEQNVLEELAEHELKERQRLLRYISSSSIIKDLIETDAKILQDSKRAGIEVDMFTAAANVSNRLKEYEIFLRDFHQDVSHAKMPKISFSRNNQLHDVLDHVTAFGYLRTHRTSFRDIEIEKFKEEDIKLADDASLPSVSGCCLLPDGQLILCDPLNKRVKLLHRSFAVKDSLDFPEQPRDVSVINDKTAVTTIAVLKQLQFIQLKPALSPGATTQLDKPCWGIEVVGNDMYVTLHNNIGEGEVRILDLQGNLKRRLGMNQDGSFMFVSPSCISVNARSGKIYVSDPGSASVTCLTSDGSVVYKYKDKCLKWPRGVCIDHEENIIVCGRHSDNIHVVTASGVKHGNLLSPSDDLESPSVLAYRQADNTLVIGCWRPKKLLVYKVV